MNAIFSKFDTSQFVKSWLKLEAPLNILAVPLETNEDIFQFDISLLKLEALLNIPVIVVTFETFQFDISPLKDSAS